MGTKVEEVLEEHTTNTGRHEYKVKWVGYTNCHSSWIAEEDLHANCLLEQFQASRSSATTDRVQSTEDSAQLVGIGERGGFPTEFLSLHSGNSSQR